jgi:CRISPR-associated protein Csd2
VIWWKHNCKAGQYSAARVHESLRNLLQNDGSFDEAALKTTLVGLEPEVIEGF